MPSLVSEIPYASFLVYSPRGKNKASIQSRSIRDFIKNFQPERVSVIIHKLKQEYDQGTFNEILGPNVTLVPLPRSAPLLQRGSVLWPGREICNLLVQAGLGKIVMPCLERVEPVPKSAFSFKGERPLPKTHFQSMKVNPLGINTSKITLVDDFITLGSTMLGAWSHMQHMYPDKQLNAFILVRTKGLTPEIDKIREPFSGKIKLTGDKAERDPN